MGLLNSDKVIVGYDLRNDFTQISFSFSEKGDVSTLPQSSDAEHFNIPTPDELVFISLADHTDYRWNANGNGDQGNVIHLDTVKGSNCKFKLKKVVDKDGNVSNDDMHRRSEFLDKCKRAVKNPGMAVKKIKAKMTERNFIFGSLTITR